MFGYVVVNQPEIKIKDFDEYRSFYCGLCRELRERFGISGQITISYDLTFVLLLLDGLYEPPVRKGKTRCAVHPVRTQKVRKSRITEYAADMNLILTYYKCLDDWNDEKKFSRLCFAKLLEKGNRKIEASYRQKVRRIVSLLEQLSAWERAGETDIDKMSGCFGKIMEEIFAYQKDHWEPSLRRMGFYLGKYIYLLDAYEDVEKDVENGNYNPFSQDYIMEGFEEQVRKFLLMMLAEACREFEKLPILRHGDILRNILYSGVWTRFETVSRERREKREKEHVRSI